MLTNRKRSFRKGLLASAACGLLTITGAALVPCAAHAQGFTTFLGTGTVVDANGKPIEGATVTVRSQDQGFSRSATTSRDGTYSLPELRNGTYDFTVEAPGHETYSEANVRLAAGAASNQFRLGIISGDGEVTVTGKRVKTTDFDLTTTGQVINVADIASRLPVARSLTAIILQAPGTAAGSGAFGGLPSVNGSAVSENAYFVNGLNITDFRKGLSPVSIPFEFYQTVEVKTGGFAAEFGRTTGGFTSATTKSGSNEFHGGLLFTWNPNGLRSYGKDTLFSDNDGGKSEARSTILQLSGPIWKDHLFFYGLYQARDNTSSAGGRQFLGDPRTSDVSDPSKYLGTSRSYYSTHSPFYAGKIDAVITDGQRIDFTYFNTSGNDLNRYYGDTTAQARRYNYLTNTDGPYSGQTTSEYGGSNYVARYTGIWTKWLTLSAAYGRNESIYNFQSVNASNTIVPGAVDLRDPFNTRTLTIAGGSQGINDDVRKFYRADADVYVNFLGSHHFKGGYDREDLASNSLYLPAGNGIGYSVYTAASGNPYGLAAGTDYVQTSVYRQSGAFTSRNSAYYIEDSWSLFANRLNLNLGLRNDRFTNNNALNQTFYKSGNQWGPRLGFTFDPVGEQRDKFYGSFGRLYIPVASNTNIRLTGGETYFTRTNLFAGLSSNNVPILGSPVLYSGAAACPDDKVLNCSVTGNGQPKEAATTVSSTLKPQSADEYILGYEKRLGSRWRIGAFFTYTKLNAVLEDAAIDSAAVAYCNAQKATGCGQWGGFDQYVLINPGRPITVQLAYPINGEATGRTVTFSAAQLGYPRAVRTYKAMTFEAHREFDGVWSLDASYTYSKTIGNYEGGVKTDNGQSDTGLTTDFDQPGLVNGTYGYSPNDKRHVIKLAGSYLFFNAVNVGINLQAYAPRKYGCIGRVPNSVDPYAGAYGAAGLYCQVNSNGSINTDPSVTAPVKLVQRGSVFSNDWVITNDLDISYKFNVGKASMTLRGTVFNVLNLQAVTNLNEVGTNGQGVASPYYRTITGYQTPRNARLQLSFDF